MLNASGGIFMPDSNKPVYPADLKISIWSKLN